MILLMWWRFFSLSPVKVALYRNFFLAKFNLWTGLAFSIFVFGGFDWKSFWSHDWSKWLCHTQIACTWTLRWFTSMIDLFTSLEFNHMTAFWFVYFFLLMFSPLKPFGINGFLLLWSCSTFPLVSDSLMTMMTFVLHSLCKWRWIGSCCCFWLCYAENISDFLFWQASAEGEGLLSKQLVIYCAGSVPQMGSFASRRN